MDVVWILIFACSLIALGAYIGWHMRASPEQSLLGRWHTRHLVASYAAAAGLLGWCVWLAI